MRVPCSRMKRAQSTPHAMTLRQASIEPFGSLHGSNAYGAFMEEQKMKSRFCTRLPAPLLWVVTQLYRPVHWTYGSWPFWSPAQVAWIVYAGLPGQEC